MNEYYSEIISGLVLSEQHHCQLETALLAEANKTEEPTPKKDSDKNLSYQ